MDAIMQPSSAAFALIEQFEGCRLRPYKDANGNLTIGWGHKCTDLAPYATSNISQSMADQLLSADVASATLAIKRFTYVNLSQEQLDALCSLVFNIGSGDYYSSTLRKMLNVSDYHNAADQFLVWDKINGTHNHWQAKRRLAEHDLFLKGTK